MPEEPKWNFSLTYNGQVDLGITGGRIPKVDPTPIHALIGHLEIVEE
jgi:hypothetical protein